MKDINEEIPEAASEELQEIDQNKPLKKVAIGNFARKESFLGKQIRITILSPALKFDNFGKHQIHYSFNGMDWLLSINLSNLNQLIDLLGEKPADWVGKSVLVSGKTKSFQIDGQNTEGIELLFTRA